MAAALPLRVTTTSSSRSSTPVTNSGKRALTSEMGRIFAMLTRIMVHQRSPGKQRAEAAAGHAAVQLAAERLLAELRGGEQAAEIDAGIDAHRLEEVHQVLGADVAGVAAAVLHLRRMPADAAEGRVEMAHA